MQEPEEVREARSGLAEVNRWFMLALLGSLVPLGGLLAASSVDAWEAWIPWILAGLVVYGVGVLTWGVRKGQGFSGDAEVVQAWEALRRKEISDRLEVQVAPPAALHPFVGQISSRAPALSGEAQRIGRRLLTLEREQGTLTETLERLPEGPARAGLQETASTLAAQHTEVLEALALLFKNAVEGVPQRPELEGLLSEVPLAVEESVQVAKHRTREREGIL